MFERDKMPMDERGTSKNDELDKVEEGVKYEGDSEDDCKLWHTYLFWALEAARFDLAEPLFRRALELQPTLEDAHINLGTILLERGFLSLAAARFQEATRLNPGSENALVNLQVATEMLTELKGLIPGVEQSAQTTHRGNPALLAQLSTLYAAVGRMDEAVSAGEKALELLGTEPSRAAARIPGQRS